MKKRKYGNVRKEGKEATILYVYKNKLTNNLITTLIVSDRSTYFVWIRNFT